MWDGTSHHVAIRGTEGAALWGYREAATFSAWTIRQGRDGKWYLSAVIKRGEPFMLRQTPLLFSAPRKGGYWAWGIEQIDAGPTHLSATLGPPER